MLYEKLTKEQKQQILDRRIEQYEQEHYAHYLNNTEESKAAMAKLDQAHAATKAEQAKLRQQP